jgi:hypothetical protein
MRCPVCYIQIPDDSAFCTNCGAKVKIEQTPDSPPNRPQGTYNAPTYQSNTPPRQPLTPQIDDAGCLAIFISFFAPFIGLALYLVWKEYRPNSAKTCLITALVSIGISVLGGVIVFVTGIAGMFASMEDYEYLIQNLFNFIKL